MASTTPRTTPSTTQTVKSLLGFHPLKQTGALRVPFIIISPLVPEKEQQGSTTPKISRVCLKHKILAFFPIMKRLIESSKRNYLIEILSFIHHTNKVSEKQSPILKERTTRTIPRERKSKSESNTDPLKSHYIEQPNFLNTEHTNTTSSTDELRKLHLVVESMVVQHKFRNLKKAIYE
jgi:hypothetical protein